MSLFAIIVIAVSFIGCEGWVTLPEVSSTSPTNGATDAAYNGPITATFKDAMDSTTINDSTFIVSKAGTPVTGSVAYDVPSKKAIFTPSVDLDYSEEYRATLTTGVKTSASVAMAENKVWSFTTASAGIGASAVDLGTAGDFAILAKTGVSTVPASVITGDVGLSPAARSYLTGFSDTLDSTGTFSTSTQVTGGLFAATMTSPTPSNLTTAVADMQTAYNFAAGRTLPDELNLLSGAIGGATLTPGLYKWSSSVNISGSDLILSGSATDTWIFQIDGDLSLASAINVTLIGGALPENIVWQVAGTVTMGTTSHFEGVVLCMTLIDMQAGATMNGRLLAQTEVTLNQATVTQP